MKRFICNYSTIIRSQNDSTKNCCIEFTILLYKVISGAVFKIYSTKTDHGLELALYPKIWTYNEVTCRGTRILNICLHQFTI